MEELKVTEESEKQVVWIESKKRKSKIKVHVPFMNQFGHWEVTYEDGRKIPELPGKFTSKKEAVQKAFSWLEKTKHSKEAKHQELFGDKKPPELKRKKVARASSTDNG